MSVRTLKSASEIDALFKNGRRGNGRLLVILASRTPAQRDPGGRVVFIAGKKLGGAVARNRCKRVLREAVRRAGGAWPGQDLAIIARPGARCAPPAELDRALATALVGAGVTR